MALAVALAAALTGLVGCGTDEDAEDLADTCADVRRAFPPSLYDDADNKAFAERLGEILEDARPATRDAFEDVVESLGLVVAAAGDNTAVVTATTDLLGALEEVDDRCREADGPAVTG